ncbi:MAG: HD domain-containing protein [Thermoguttaceae bacterium]
MSSILTIPELIGLDSRDSLIRIPPELDVPLTDRVRRLIDTSAFRRLARISQLGLVPLVYPAAHHTRFEHSLGVFRLALLLLKRLAYDSRFISMIGREDAELLIVSALLHDIGHWPFCHALEDIRLAGVPEHEQAAKRFLLEGEIPELLHKDWNVDPNRVVALLNKTEQVQSDPVMQLFSSILSGPIDIDKMDYLFRDSLHAGVPYGRHVDQNRLITSLCLNKAGNGLAITEKGKTAAELMVFARYVMFNEVYWNHGVRTATAMLQRAFYLLFDRLDLDRCMMSTEGEMIAYMRDVARGTPAEILLEGLFGEKRRLYKRVAQYSIMEEPDLYRLLAGRAYTWSCSVAEKLAASVKKTFGTKIGSAPILLDAPPVLREVEIRIDVYYPKEQRYRPLETVSPVVRSLAQEQFDDFVKRVRIFAPLEIAPFLRQSGFIADWLTANVPPPV